MAQADPDPPSRVERLVRRAVGRVVERHVANGTMAGISCDGFFQEVSAEVAVMLYQRAEKNRRRIRKAAGRVCADRVLLAAWRPAPAAAVAEHGWVEFDLARFSLVRAENRPAAGSCVPAPWPVESN